MINKEIIPAYILFGQWDLNRREHLIMIQKELNNLTLVEPIFPKYQKVPFLNQLVHLSKIRTGKALSAAEVGVLLGHRAIWRKIIQSECSPSQHFLVLESDSKLNNPNLLKTNFNKFTAPYDLFFWGAWDGHARIHRSTVKFKEGDYRVGAPLIKSVYCTYGYSLNKKAAAYLLKATSKISYPVDIYKKYIQPGALAIGAARPEIIGAWYNTPSTIQEQSTGIKIKRFLIVQIFDLRNRIHAYFS
jgi:GR25 family glycosyltransferase involved in LPS biosynthesis